MAIEFLNACSLIEYQENVMGFDLFVHRFQNGTAAPYPSKVAEKIFDRGARQPSDLKYVEYHDGRGEIYCGRNGEDFDGFMLAHFRGNTICERILEIARITQSLIYWPSEYILFAVTDRSVIAHVPQEIKTKGMLIAIVQTVDDLWAAINAEEDSSDGVLIAFPET